MEVSSRGQQEVGIISLETGKMAQRKTSFLLHRWYLFKLYKYHSGDYEIKVAQPIVTVRRITQFKLNIFVFLRQNRLL
jgi:hypothetical protein